ncbi:MULTISPECIES: hypothetical protein [Mycobacterium]|uniref:hypothetical protein n=1 Tax=Mycobacterium TaxID=1763 RepID=UPI001938421D|nr:MULTISPECIES: hypothetical protein [Mycobacterium]WSE51452.1 hypothetical protein QGN31_25850 [Mycobacterium sp. 2-64]BCO49649.1 hypothetical protein MINTM003_00900 [Mycobacterium paraintracellulare]BCO86838.1 hypothetical protein MINTM015_00950 [Mycobacterium paraintracellulare]
MACNVIEIYLPASSRPWGSVREKPPPAAAAASTDALPGFRKRQLSDFRSATPHYTPNA